MAAKWFFLLLGGLFCIKSIYTITLNEKELEKWQNSLSEQYDEQCRKLLNEESAHFLEDNIIADDEDIRKYRLCLSNHAEYIVDNQINIDSVLEDLSKMFSFSDEEKSDAVVVLSICKEKSEEASGTLEDLAGILFNCIMETIQSEI